MAPKPVTWVVGTDNSECARHALDTCLELMSPDDNLWVFYAGARHGRLLTIFC